MHAWSRIALAALVIVAAPAWSAAQNQGNDESRVRVVTGGAQSIRDDLKAIIELAPGSLKKQAGNVDDTLDSFQQGVDPDKPLALDIVFAPNETIYQSAIPVKKLEGRDGFIDNLKAMFKVTALDAGLYTLTNPPPAAGNKKAATKVGAKAPPKAAPPAGAPAQTYYMRHVHGHAVFSPRKTDLPANLPDPSAPLKKLLGNRDVVVRIDNELPTLEKHRATYKEFRKQLEAAIKFKRGEAEADFEMRKLSAQQSFNELERFLIESKLLEIGWTTDTVKMEGRGEFRLEALPKTSLEDSVHLLVKDPGYFANVKLHNQPVIALRSNFAIDPMRSQHAKDLYEALRPAIKLRIDERPTLNDDNKQAAKEAIDKLLDMFEAARAIQVLDGFIDLHSAKEKNTLVCGIRCVNGHDAAELLDFLPKIRDGWKVEKNVEEVGGVKIHKVEIARHRREEFESLFAGPAVAYLGTCKDAVWGAAGDNSLAELKEAIAAVGEPAPKEVDQEFFSLTANFGPLLDLMRILREKEPKPKLEDKDAQAEWEQQQKTRAKWNKFAKDSFDGCKVGLEASLRREDDAVIGKMTVHQCVLQFLGSVTANWSAENLQ